MQDNIIFVIIIAAIIAIATYVFKTTTKIRKSQLKDEANSDAHDDELHEIIAGVENLYRTGRITHSEAYSIIEGSWRDES